MTTRAVYFGQEQRCLYGVLHRPAGMARGGLLVCAPLFQEAMRTYRALWTLAEKLAASGWIVLRFDWFGSGNSQGQAVEMEFEGLVADIDEAARFLRVQFAATGAPEQAAEVAILGVRSAALPVLAYACGLATRVELILLAPQLDGEAVANAWRAQHQDQLLHAGRYPFGQPLPGRDDLLGYSVSNELLDAFQQLNAASLELHPGSRLLMAGWDVLGQEGEAFISTQRRAGCTVGSMALEPAETPLWEAPDAFEKQVFPRRSIAHLASALSSEAR